MAESDSAITRCPECRTTFRVTSSQLQVAAGKVRCGACLQVFEASQYLLDGVAPSGLDAAGIQPTEQDQNPTLIERFHAGVEGRAESQQSVGDPDDQVVGSELEEPLSAEETTDTLPAESESSTSGDIDVDGDDPALEIDLTDAQTGVTADLLAVIDETPEPQQNPVSAAIIQAEFWAMFADYMAEQLAPRTEKAPDYDNLFHLEGESLPEGLDVASQLRSDSLAQVEIDAPVQRNHAGFAWYAAGLLFIAMLAVQYAWQSRYVYSQDKAYREYYELACGYLGCAVPDFRDLGQLQTSRPILRTHPNVSQALIVDAVISNLAEIRQPFPDLKLTFTDENSRIVAARRFLPAEYLAGEMRGMRYIPGRTEVRFSLEIHDPGEHALGYTLDVVPST